jgi:cytochrome c2
VVGADCKSCHSQEHKRWASTLHAADANAVLLNSDHNTEELLTDECITCHAPFQAGTFKIGDFVQPLDQNGPWHLVSANAGRWQAIRCEVCHDPASTAPNKLGFYDFAKQSYVAVGNTTELCEKCHQPGTDDSRNLKGSVHEGFQCVSCHFQEGSEMSLDPHGACAQCHPQVNTRHPDVTKLDTTYVSKDGENDIHFINCATCHPANSTDPTNNGASYVTSAACGTCHPDKGRVEFRPWAQPQAEETVGWAAHLSTGRYAGRRPQPA